MLRLIALLLAVASVVALACGSSPPSTEDLAEQLPSIPAQPADLSAVATEGAWDVASEGQVNDAAFGELSAGVLAAAATQAQPIDAYERALESAGAVLVERPYPPAAYSAALLFASPGDAKTFFDAAALAASETDWLSANPSLDGATPAEAQTGELPIAISSVVDQLLWLHSSALAGEDTITDDLLLVRDGRMVAMVRATGRFAGTEARLASTSLFEPGLAIPVTNRLHEAVD